MAETRERSERLRENCGGTFARRALSTLCAGCWMLDGNREAKQVSAVRANIARIISTATPMNIIGWVTHRAKAVAATKSSSFRFVIVYARH